MLLLMHYIRKSGDQLGSKNTRKYRTRQLRNCLTLVKKQKLLTNATKVEMFRYA